MHSLLLLLLCAAPVTVSGQVLDTDGDPVAGATVELRDELIFDGPRANKAKVAHATTDAAGRFSVSLDFDATMAHADAKGYDQTGAFAMKDWVAVPAGGGVLKFTLRKRHLATITGSVVDEGNAPIVGALVGPPGGNRESSTFTDAAGGFSLSALAGLKELFVWHKGYASQNVPVSDKPMKIVMLKRPTIALYLVDAKGQSIRGHQVVEVRRADGTRLSSCNTRDVEGDCTLEAELGEVTVSATVNGTTVKQTVRLESSKKVDLRLQF